MGPEGQQEPGSPLAPGHVAVPCSCRQPLAAPRSQPQLRPSGTLWAPKASQHTAGGGSRACTTPQTDARALTAFSADVLGEFVQPGGGTESRSEALASLPSLASPSLASPQSAPSPSPGQAGTPNVVTTAGPGRTLQWCRAPSRAGAARAAPRGGRGGVTQPPGVLGACSDQDTGAWEPQARTEQHLGAGAVLQLPNLT